MAKFKKAIPKRAAIRPNTAEDDEENDSALERIQVTQKKQKLAHATLYRRGLDATAKPEPVKEVKQSMSVDDPKDKLFKTTFSSTDNHPTETIMQLKHMVAMEEFINKKLSDTKPSNLEETEHCSHIHDSVTNVKEADMGAGGTMLGGTGIAEVILPVEMRLETVKQTEAFRTRLPGGGAVGKKLISSAGFLVDKNDGKEIKSSLSENFRSFNQQRQQLTSSPIGKPAIATSDTEPIDHDERVGFQAARHAQLKEPRYHQRRGNDDRLLKQFIKRERTKR